MNVNTNQINFKLLNYELIKNIFCSGFYICCNDWL